jgi:ribosomal protein S18 acetylase RimI-like enzyme
MINMPVLRPGTPDDLQAVTGILAESPETAQWDPAQCLAYDFTIADADGVAAAFLVARTLAPGEHEILNLAVAARYRRRGLAGCLIRSALERLKGDIYLEVRESNVPAVTLYKSFGFEPVSTRPGYYSDPREPAIVLKFHSC